MLMLQQIYLKISADPLVLKQNVKCSLSSRVEITS